MQRDAEAGACPDRCRKKKEASMAGLDLGKDGTALGHDSQTEREGGTMEGSLDCSKDFPV